jgi:pimeloyl-ACP methyl ester carboxylesterase
VVDIEVQIPGAQEPHQQPQGVALSLEEFRYAFTNTLSEESQVAYERHAVPGPGRVLFQAVLANFNRAATSVDFHNDDRAPLLFVAGGKDHVSPAVLNESNARRYFESKALTVYEEFPLRLHFTLGEEGWELVADYALSWAIENAGVCPVQR